MSRKNSQNPQASVIQTKKILCNVRPDGFSRRPGLLKLLLDASSLNRFNFNWPQINYLLVGSAVPPEKECPEYDTKTAF